MKRLSLPLSVFKEINLVINKTTYNKDNIGFINALMNAMRSLDDYEYQEAIDILNFIKEDYPSLINYNSCVKKIVAAQKRYNLI